MESANLPDKRPDANASVPVRIHRTCDSAANEHMPKSIWQSGVVKRLGDYIKHLREVDQQPDQPNEPCQSAEPKQFGNVCARNPHRTCNCPSGSCADDDATYRLARGPFIATGHNERVCAPKPNKLGNFRCPITGQLCSSSICMEWCKGSGVGATLDSSRRNAKTTDNS